MFWWWGLRGFRAWSSLPIPVTLDTGTIGRVLPTLAEPAVSHTGHLFSASVAGTFSVYVSSSGVSLSSISNAAAYELRLSDDSRRAR